MLYFPVDPNAKLTLGLRSLKLANWFELDADRCSLLVQKDQLLQDQFDEVAAQLPIGEAGALEFYQLAAENLLEFFPETFRKLDSEIFDAEMNRSVPFLEDRPLVSLARLVQEDVSIMTLTDAGWTLSAAVMCSPSRWRMREKLGKELSGIHAPVPEYEAQIAQPVAAMFDKILPERPMWRANWTLLDDAALFQPGPATPKQLSASVDIGNEIFFRVERQTIRKLPESGDIAFTVRTYVMPLAQAVETADDAADLLASAIRNSLPAVHEYRGWQLLAPRVLDWLDQRRG